MWGSLIGAATGVLGNIIGGNKMRKAQQQEEMRQANADANQAAMYAKSRYADPTQLASAQRVLTLTNQKIREAARQNAGTAAVMGYTNAQQAANKSDMADMQANTMADIAASGSARADQLDSAEAQRLQGVDTRKAQQFAQRQQSQAAALSNMTKAAGAMGQAIDDNEKEIGSFFSKLFKGNKGQ